MICGDVVKNADPTSTGVDYRSYLEPGVRRLVEQCIDVLGCVTHSSCEGRPPTADSELRLRRVAITPRDDREHAQLRVLLQRCAARVNSAVGASSWVTVEIRESDLRSDSLPPRPTLNIVFAPQPRLATRDYFEHLAITYVAFCDELCGSTENRRDHTPAGSAANLMSRDLLSAVRQFYDMALSWHCKEPTTQCAAGGIAAKALHLHAMNFGLWHHEDAVRRPSINDHEVARRKRCIDDLNTRRNAAIEDLDVTLLDRLHPNQNPDATLHTETPGTIVDRLSVLTLRILHSDSAQHCSRRRALLEDQYDDLFSGLEQFLARVRRGDLRFKLYRQYKSAGQRSYCSLFETRQT